MKKSRLNLKVFKALLFSLSLVFTLAVSSGCGRETGGASSNPPAEKDKWVKVCENTYVLTSSFYMANMTMATSGTEGILIDTGMNSRDLQEIKRFLEEKNIRLKTIIITHTHDDHSANLKALQGEGVTCITPREAKDGQIIELGTRKLRITFTEGHQVDKGHISVELVDENILVAGDIICNNILPPIASGGNINTLLPTLKKLEEKKYALIIPGHGDMAETDVLFAKQFEYLGNAKSRVEKLISEGKSGSDVGSIKLEDCIKDTSNLYSEMLEYWHQQNLRKIYENLTQK